MRCSGFGHISYFFFHFIKQKNLNSFCKIFSKHKISKISDFSEFLLFSELETLKSASEASEAASINSEAEISIFFLFLKFSFFSGNF